MGRLIDADKLKNMKFSKGLREDGILYVPFGEMIRNINYAPTAYDVDKVVEKVQNIHLPLASQTSRIVGIIRKGGVECTK